MSNLLTFIYYIFYSIIKIAKFSPVAVREIRKVEVSDCPIPDWYQMPQIFKLVA